MKTILFAMTLLLTPQDLLTPPDYGQDVPIILVVDYFKFCVDLPPSQDQTIQWAPVGEAQTPPSKVCERAEVALRYAAGIPQREVKFIGFWGVPR